LVGDPAVVTLPRHDAYRSNLDYQRLRRWCRESRKIVIVYQDRNGVETQSTVWQFMMGYVTGAQVVIAWCEMREDFRVFETSGLRSLSFVRCNTQSAQPYYVETGCSVELDAASSAVGSSDRLSKLYGICHDFKVFRALSASDLLVCAGY
jgi:hypothetical protein